MDRIVVGIIMGSDSDLEVMNEAAMLLEEFQVSYEMRIVSAHRTPDVMAEYAREAQGRGIEVIIAGASGSAHLPGMTAAHTTLPVLAVPIKKPDHGHEALWSSVNMPHGVPLAVMPENGAKNAALMAVAILALGDEEMTEKYETYRRQQAETVTLADNRLAKEGWKKYRPAGA